MSLTDSIRLQLYLSRNGKWSRRKAAKIIEAGRVQINGEIILKPFYRVSESDKVFVDNKLLSLDLEQKSVWLLNKPMAVICSSFDSQGRVLAKDLINQKNKRIYTVGRLDYNSTGLILLTNDGDLAHKIMHPSNEIEKEYLVKTTTPIKEDFMKKFIKGFIIDGINYKIKMYEIQNRYTVKLTLNEGKNREIRRVFEHANYSISQLKRIRIGQLSMDFLKLGESKLLTKEEIKLIFS